MNKLQLSEPKRTWPVANELYQQALDNEYISANLSNPMGNPKLKYILIGQTQFTKLVDAIARDTLQPPIEVARNLRNCKGQVCGYTIVPCDLPSFCALLL